MRKVFFILCMAICSICLTSCGDDDKGSSRGGNSTSGGSSTGGGSGSTIVDGVHVNPRKLLTIDLYKQDNTNDNLHFAMSYDSKGRLSKVNMTNGERSIDLLNIDYDLNLITASKEDSFYSSYNSEAKDHYPFSLNKFGFISSLSNCEFSYNDDGYLIGANTVKDIWTFAYNEGEIIKFMVETLKTGNLQIYYMYYGEKEGELYFTLNGKFSGRSDWSYNDLRTVSMLILYHAGFFGNISKHCSNLSAYSSKGTVIDQISGSKSTIVHCSFKIE